MELSIDKSAFGGSSISFTGGRAVFVSYTIPGEIIEADIVADKKDFCSARIVSVKSASPDRILPECPVFGICGGCDYLHMSYERELAEKSSIIIDSLKRIAKMPEADIPEIDVISGSRFHYRSHASVKQSGGKKGFFASSSHSMIPFPAEGCRLLSDALNIGIQKYQTSAEEFKAALEASGIFYAAVPGKEIIITEEMNGIVYERNIHSFFQANMPLRPMMAERTVQYASGAENILELGCGGGFFTLQLARHCKKINGIEIAADAVKSAENNKKRNTIENAFFSRRSDETIDPVKDRADTIVADPPRAGLSAKTRQAVITMKPERLVYVSCNPSTWARDVKDFTLAGYRLSKLTFIDMFPGTQHIEIVSLLE